MSDVDQKTSWNQIMVICPGNMTFAQMQTANEIVSHAVGDVVSMPFSLTEQGFFVGFHALAEPCPSTKPVEEALEVLGGNSAQALIILMHDGRVIANLDGLI